MGMGGNVWKTLIRLLRLSKERVNIINTSKCEINAEYI